MNATLKQAHGAVVQGDRFWNRTHEIEEAIKKLEEGAHLLLIAQRRMGKTSLLREVERRTKGKFACLFVDLQKAMRSADFVTELGGATRPFKSLWNKTRDVFSNILGTVAGAIEQVEVAVVVLTLRAGLTPGNWKAKGDQLFAALAASGEDVVVLLDELPIMVNRLLTGGEHTITPKRRQETDEFMSWLRANALEHQGKVRLVLSGSIGLEPVLRRAELSGLLNAYVPFELPPWTDTTAIGCLRALAKQYGLEFVDDSERAAVGLLGSNIPHHIQTLFDAVRKVCQRRGVSTVDGRVVQDAYDGELLGVRGHVELSHYEERLCLVLGKQLVPFAFDMLTEAAVTGVLTSAALTGLRKDFDFGETTAAAAQANIISVLEHDGYFRRSTDGYRFVSNLMRDWWKARHEFAFVPVLQRGR